MKLIFWQKHEQGLNIWDDFYYWTEVTLNVFPGTFVCATVLEILIHTLLTTVNQKKKRFQTYRLTTSPCNIKLNKPSVFFRSRHFPFAFSAHKNSHQFPLTMLYGSERKSFRAIIIIIIAVINCRKCEYLRSQLTIPTPVSLHSRIRKTKKKKLANTQNGTEQPDPRVPTFPIRCAQRNHQIAGSR